MHQAGHLKSAVHLLTGPKEEHGFWSWISTVDHKRIGILYGATAFFFFLLGGIEALLLRIQALLLPIKTLVMNCLTLGATLVSPDEARADQAGLSTRTRLSWSTAPGRLGTAALIRSASARG